MTQKDKDAVIAALEEYTGDSTGLIAATIEDCQQLALNGYDTHWILTGEMKNESQ